MKVFVTGSSSHFAAALLPRLCDRPEIERVPLARSVEDAVEEAEEHALGRAGHCAR